MSSNTPVGVTIAYRKKAQEQTESDDRHYNYHHHQAKPNEPNEDSDEWQSSREGTPPRSRGGAPTTTYTAGLIVRDANLNNDEDDATNEDISTVVSQTSIPNVCPDPTHSSTPDRPLIRATSLGGSSTNSLAHLAGVYATESTLPTCSSTDSTHAPDSSTGLATTNHPSTKTTTTTLSFKGAGTSSYHKPVSSFRVLLEGATLYLACLILPSVLGHFYQVLVNGGTLLDWDKIQQFLPTILHPFSFFVVQRDGSKGGEDGEASFSTWMISSLSHFFFSSFSSSPWAVTLSEQAYATYLQGASYVCPTHVDADSYWAYVCPLPTLDSREAIAARLYSPDANPRHDSLVVLSWAMILALIRLYVMRLLVLRPSRRNRHRHNRSSTGTGEEEDGPTLSDDGSEILQALVRSKSIHLLSSNYHMTPPVTPRKMLSFGDTIDVNPANIGVGAGKDDDDDDDATVDENLEPPDLSSNTNAITTAPINVETTSGTELLSWRNNQNEHAGSAMATSAGQDEDDDYVPTDLAEGSSWGWEVHASERDLGALDSLDHQNINSPPDHDNDNHDPRNMPLVTLTSAAGLEESLLRAQATEPLSPTSAASLSSTSLYAAPRFATAVFRLCYSIVASVMAWYWFHNADFWPWYVGGTQDWVTTWTKLHAANGNNHAWIWLTGSSATKHCWDLSGGLTVGMDADFDHRNTSLRHLFLMQASYHVHSGAFHLLSLAMLIYRRMKVNKAKKVAKLSSNQKPRRPSLVFYDAAGTSAYFRSLFQHLLALLLIGIAYVFSSLRRLAAIGMFAFDVGSCFLHLLQICINAPPTSALSRPVVVQSVYRYLVLPTFVVTRFGVWPLLWYSAVFESKEWLRQLENTSIQGTARVMRGIFHVWMAAAMALTVVYFRRLFTHEHLKRFLSKDEGLNRMQIELAMN